MQAIDLLGLGTPPFIIELQGCQYGGPFSLVKLQFIDLPVVLLTSGLP